MLLVCVGLAMVGGRPILAPEGFTGAGDVGLPVPDGPQQRHAQCDCHGEDGPKPSRSVQAGFRAFALLISSANTS